MANDQLRAALSQMTPGQKQALALQYDVANTGDSMPIHEPGAGLRPKTLWEAMRRLILRGHKVNLCPFGCQEEHLDEHGYCRHLVGFTNNGQTYEPMRRDPNTGRRSVQVKRSRRACGVDDEGNEQFEEGPLELLPIKPTDKVIQITTTARVYRELQAKKGA